MISVGQLQKGCTARFAGEPASWWCAAAISLYDDYMQDGGMLRRIMPPFTLKPSHLALAECRGPVQGQLHGCHVCHTEHVPVVLFCAVLRLARRLLEGKGKREGGEGKRGRGEGREES